MPRTPRLRANIFELQALEVRRFLTVASINNSTHTLVVTGTSSADTITLNQSASTGKVSVSGVSTTFTPGTGSGQFNKISVDGAGGNDVIQINGNVAYTNSTLGGGGGNDSITGGSKADQISGGSGFDTANYSLRTTKVTVTIDGVANDGASGEGDNVTSDTEEVIGGSGNDSFTGDDAHDNFFAGGAGNDSLIGKGANDDLTGSTGNDSLDGGTGSDFLQAKNNDVDTVKGGSGAGDTDLAEVDGIDVSAARAQAAAAAAAAGIDRTQLDPSYNQDDPNNADGLNTGPDFNWSQVSAAAVDSQGRVIIVGTDIRTNGEGYSSDDMVAMRYNADGTVDNGFGYNGEAVIDFTPGFGYGFATNDTAYGVTTDSNDNIYIVGASDGDFALVKLNSSGGSRDSLFGNNGTAVEDFNANEGVGGGYNDEAHDVIVDGLGNVVVVGWQNNNSGADVVVMRFTNQGFLDPNFNGSGQTFLDVNAGNGTYDTANAVALQPNGNFAPRIVVAGGSDGSLLLARFNDDGSVDNPFGNGYGYSTDGVVDGTYQTANDVALDATNIYVVGQAETLSFRGLIQFNPSSNTAAIAARYSSSGVFELGTQPGTDATTLTSVVVDPVSGHLLVAGANATNFIWGDLDQTTLTLDSNFNNGEFIETDFTPFESEYYDVALELGVASDGKVILGGFSDTNGDGGYQGSVARYGAASTGPQDNIEGIEDFISDDELNANPPAEPLKSRLQNLSTTAKLYVLAQPDDNGVATFTLTNANDVVTITNGFDENGTPQVFVNVNNFIIPYDPDTTTLFRFNLLGGNDTLYAPDGVKIPMRVYAGDGNDFVRTADGNDLIDAGKGNDIAYGGKGNDVVLGGADTDLVGGDEGNDLVIGGTGTDAVIGGGSGEDILIGGTTSHDTNEAELLAIIDEWGSANSNADRINHLRGTLSGGANGSVFLKVGVGATVFNDTSIDSLTGGSGRDWFFRKNANPNRDLILDNITGEEVTNM